MVRIWQADKRNIFIPPVLFENGRRVGPHGQNLHATIRELIVFITQARQLRAAVRSHKTAQESNHNRLAAEIGQTGRMSLYIFKFEIRSELSRGDQFCHRLISFKSDLASCQMSSNICTVNFPVCVFCWLG